MVFLSTGCVAQKLAQNKKRTEREKKKERKDAAERREQRKRAAELAKKVLEQNKAQVQSNNDQEKQDTEQAEIEKKGAENEKQAQEAREALANIQAKKLEKCIDTDVNVDAVIRGTDEVTLKDYQENLVRGIVKQTRALAYWRTGAGKTLAGVAVARQFLKINSNGAVILFAPLAVAQSWGKAFRDNGLNNNNETLVLNFEKVVEENWKASKAIDDLKGKNVCFIIDEMHLKIGSGGLFTKRLFEILDTFKEKKNWILGLSATPFRSGNFLVFYLLMAFVNYFQPDMPKNYTKALEKFKEKAKEAGKEDNKIINNFAVEAAKAIKADTKKFECVLSCQHDQSDDFPEYTIEVAKLEKANTACQKAFADLTGLDMEDLLPQGASSGPKITAKDDVKYLVNFDYVESDARKDVAVVYESFFTKFGSRSMNVTNDSRDFFEVMFKANFITQKMYYAALQCALNARDNKKTIVFFKNKDPLYIFVFMLALLKINVIKKDGKDARLLKANEQTSEIIEDVSQTFNDTKGCVAVMNSRSGGTGIDFKDVKYMYFLQLPDSAIDFYQNIGRGVRFKGYTVDRKDADVLVEYVVLGDEVKGGIRMIGKLEKLKKNVESVKQLCYTGTLQGQLDVFTKIGDDMDKKFIKKKNCEEIY